MSEIVKIHQDVLDILEKERENNPNLRYKPRQQNKYDRLSKEYWFIGDDKYLMIGFAEGGDANEKIHNIGFSIKASGQSFLDLSAQDNPEDADFLVQIANELLMCKCPKKNRWYKEYKGHYTDTLRDFIRTDLKTINRIISSKSNTTKIQLISEEKFDKYYKNINSYITSQNPAVEKVARICWNSKGWLYPSGKFGKSKSKNSYENSKGFGHEEWLFDPSRGIDGYHYSYLEQINTKNKIHQGKNYTIHLFTINAQNARCYVGKINSVECITDSDSNNAQGIYKQNGWFKEMTNEINYALGYKATGQIRIKFNIRFKLSDVQLEDSLIEINNSDRNTRSNHYVLMNKKDDFIFSFDDDNNIHGSSNTKNTSKRKRVINSTSDFEPIHDKMQNQIVLILRADSNYDSNTIYTEHENVDVKAKTTTGEMHFFELKTAVAKLSIRQALGQLLEYNHYPNKSKAEKLYIVSYYEPTPTDIAYMNYIRDTYKINVWYRYFEFGTNVLHKTEY